MSYVVFSVTLVNAGETEETRSINMYNDRPHGREMQGRGFLQG